MLGALCALVATACAADAEEPLDDEIINAGSRGLLTGKRFGLEPMDIALTLDDGPSRERMDNSYSTNPTVVIAHELAQRGIPAVFFQVGSAYQSNVEREILQYKTAEGKHLFLIGNHTQDHVILNTLPFTSEGDKKVASQITKGDETLRPAVLESLDLDRGGLDFRLFRAPGGQITNNSAKQSSADGRVRAIFKADPEMMKRYIGPVYWDVGGFATPAANGKYIGDYNCPRYRVSHLDCAKGYFNEILAHKSRGQIILAHDSHAFTVTMFTMPGGLLDMVDAYNKAHPTAPFRFVRLDRHPEKIRELLTQAPPVDPTETSTPSSE